MKLKQILTILATTLIITFMYSQVQAVNTTTVGTSKSVIQIVPDGSTDWIWEDDLSTHGSKVLRGKIVKIVFYPSDVDDRCVIRDGSATSAAYFDSGIVSSDDDPRVVEYPYPKNIRLYLLATDCTFSSATDAKILIYIED